MAVGEPGAGAEAAPGSAVVVEAEVVPGNVAAVEAGAAPGSVAGVEAEAVPGSATVVEAEAVPGNVAAVEAGAAPGSAAGVEAVAGNEAAVVTEEAPGRAAEARMEVGSGAGVASQRAGPLWDVFLRAERRVAGRWRVVARLSAIRFAVARFAVKRFAAVRPPMANRAGAALRRWEPARGRRRKPACSPAALQCRNAAGSRASAHLRSEPRQLAAALPGARPSAAGLEPIQERIAAEAPDPVPPGGRPHRGRQHRGRQHRGLPRLDQPHPGPHPDLHRGPRHSTAAPFPE